MQVLTLQTSTSPVSEKNCYLETNFSCQSDVLYTHAHICTHISYRQSICDLHTQSSCTCMYSGTLLTVILFLNLYHNFIAGAIYTGSSDVGGFMSFSSSAEEEKALGSELKNFLHLPAAQGFRCIPVWLEYKEVFRINQLPSCQIHSLLFCWSQGHTSQWVEDK